MGSMEECAIIASILNQKESFFDESIFRTPGKIVEFQKILDEFENKDNQKEKSDFINLLDLFDEWQKKFIFYQK